MDVFFQKGCFQFVTCGFHCGSSKSDSSPVDVVGRNSLVALCLEDAVTMRRVLWKNDLWKVEEMYMKCLICECMMVAKFCVDCDYHFDQNGGFQINGSISI